MDDTDQLASNCPRCFGPPSGITTVGEPDIVVCLDGNFSHKRMATASVPIPGHNPEAPELFLDPTRIQKMAAELGQTAAQPTHHGLVVRIIDKPYIMRCYTYLC